MQEEIWKDIKGYEGLYKISNYGRVKSFHFGKERIRKPSDSRGYPIIKLNKGGKYTVDGEYLDTYPSLAEAARTFGLFYPNIAKVCRGENKTSGGYKWKFSEST